MSNLDPALDGGRRPGVQAGQTQPSFDRSHSGHAHHYRPDIAGQQYAPPPQQTPYYHPPPTNQPSNTPNDTVSSLSAQPTPDAHAFLQPTDQQEFAQADDGQAAQDDPKRQRACEACRGLKVRCDQDPAQPDVPCKRCAKAGRPCIITQPSRKRQKKADSRVAELEKKLDALTAVLNNRHGMPLDAPVSSAPLDGSQAQQLAWQAEAQASSQEPPAKRRRTVEGQSEWDTRFAQLQLSHKFPDAKNFLHADNFTNRVMSLVSPTQRAELFKRYTDEMTEQLPLVVFPKGTTSDQVSSEKPILYLAMITAASFGLVPMAVTTQLQDETMAAIADLSIRRGVKSLELIQAMQVICLFYKPPAKAEQTNFYQLVHMAAAMALDIGLGRRFRKPQHAIGRQEVAFSARALSGQNSDLIEARRAWLGCYYLSASASMVLRRPNLVRWSDYMRECIDVLSTSPDAAPSDRQLCEHIKIIHICEDIGQQFLMDDSNAQISINDPKVTYALNVFENQLTTWRQQVPPEVYDRGLQFFEHVTSLYLHEIALHMNHNVEDFRLPFTEESLKNVDSTPEALSPNKIAAIEACLKAAHGILTTTLQYNVDELLALPMLLFFVRCVYALVILIKMHVAITMPGSELGKIIKPEDLKVEEYVHRLLKLFTQMGESRAAKPEKIMKIMSVLSEWFVSHKETVAKQRSRSAGGNPQQASTTHSGYDQTPLQMLSQVATGQQSTQATDWNAGPDASTGYRPQPQQNQSDTKLPMYQAQQSTDTANPYDPNILSMLDLLSGQDYGWGSNFDQAVDMTFGGMGDLPGYGLGNWSMGIDNNSGAYNANGGAQGPWNGV